jgi:hypothetical protein
MQQRRDKDDRFDLLAGADALVASVGVLAVAPMQGAGHAFSGVPNIAGWSNTGNLSGLGGWGVGAIEWVGLSTSQVGVTDQMIYDVINTTRIANAYVIRAGKKPRFGLGQPNPKWRRSQFIQAAIVADYSNGPLPDKLNHTKLTDAVNARLQSDPAFSEYREGSAAKKGMPARRGYGRTPVTRPAVIRALRMLRRANP